MLGIFNHPTTQSPNHLLQSRNPPRPHTPIRPNTLLCLSLLFNLPFFLFRVHRLAFDTNTHIFLADHYRLRWWNLWEPRWYLGFSVASYPPLAHQLIAWLSWPFGAVVAFFSPEPEPYPGAFRWLGEEIAFVVVLLIALVLFPLAVREFTRIFGGPRASNVSGLLAIFCPALSLSAWAFGQLPTVAATTAVLFALARGHAFVCTGRWLRLAQAVVLAGVAGALHHGVFLFVPFAGAAVVVRDVWCVVRQQSSPFAPRSGPSSREAVFRLFLWASLSALAVAVVLWPFLLWGRGQVLQTPIDHPSRHNFFADPSASLFFFWAIYGPLLLVVPGALWVAMKARRLRPLLGAFAVLLVLGLGGMTPLPRVLFGAGWEWLTYDRFGFWAATLLLPFAGVLMALGAPQRRRLPRVIILSFLGLLMGWASFSGWLSVVSRSQPGAVDLAPFVKLLNQPVQRPYRYLTLGFGDQLAKLSALTHNGTPDGSYHTARELSELRASGLGALDGAVWNPQGVVAVAPFLAHPERYGLRWVFANHPHYIPILIATGWRFRWMEGTVSVWDHLDVTPVAVASPPALSASPAAVWWGIAPLTALALVLITFAVERRVWAVRRKQVVQFLGMARRAAFGLTVVLLSLWWVHSLKMGALPLVYFTYQSVLVFASDLAAALTLGLWVVERGLRGERLRFGPRAVGVAGLLLTAAAALSGINSHDRALTLAFTLHLLLLAGLYLMLVNDSLSEAQTGKLFGGVLLVQAIVALVENWAQGTWLIPGLRYLLWPGSLSAASPGASVVENASGGRWLRAYGTLPHPNLLGGMLLIYLSAAIERFFATGRKRWLGLVAAGMITLALTFSRSAWAGLGVMIGASAFLLSCAHWRRARQALGVGLLAGVFTVLPLMPFLLARANVTGSETGAEQRSLGERALLVQASLDFIRARPWTGIGAGAFVVALAAQPDRYAPLEPVHNIPMLALAEMGAPGVLALLGFAGAVLRQMWLRRRRTTLPEAAWALALLGALAVGLFDHYWWTLSPVRMLFVVALGLWAGSQNTVQHGV